ncbi:META domain-containing protein [Hymenobacter sp. BT635]|uniref:META domain-containing protein n=1 Tax=Hymenobacter nitidus TaxID=2880929 RepID=A0ABS8AAK0_9BACT|nr:META domain-containing protein [Hymenobacter nitidus]MCB2377234.1 META domain-containing protein [Hymenobacter nitidus]
MLNSAFLRPAAALVLLVAPACSFDLNDRPNAGGVATDEPTAASLQDVRWELRELGGQPAPRTERRPFLVLRNNRPRVEGRASCNQFSGPYTVADRGRLRLGPLVTTRSTCPDLAAEGAFLQALNQAQRYHISNNTLTLYAADTLGTPLARLQAVAQ